MKVIGLVKIVVYSSKIKNNFKPNLMYPPTVSNQITMKFVMTTQWIYILQYKIKLVCIYAYAIQEMIPTKVIVPLVKYRLKQKWQIVF